MCLFSPTRLTLFTLIILMLTGCLGANNIKPKTPDCHISCYITRSNSNGAVLQLVVKAGSLQEEEHERGFAHFVEHMAFNDTEQYPKEALFSKLRERGIEFGSHSNAFTDFDNTTYFLVINKATEEHLDVAISILAQWAQHVQFNQDVVDAEKPILAEEWRLRSPQKASAEIQQLDALYQNSRYGKRFPVGTLESIQTAKSEDLETFYRRWYQPNNMSLMVTGGVKTSEVEALINRHFPLSKDPGAETESYALNLTDYPKAQVFIDGSVKQETVSLRHFVPYVRAVTENELFETELRKGATYILEQRLKERLKDTNGAIKNFSAKWKQWSAGTASVELSAVLSSNDRELASRLIAEETKLLLAEGISQKELDAWYEQTLEFYQRPMTTDRARELSLNHFLYGQVMLSQPEWRNILKQRLPDVGLAKMDQIIQQLFQSTPHWELQSYIKQKAPSELQLVEWLQGNSQVLGIARTSGAPSVESSLWNIKPETDAKLLDSQIVRDGVKQWRFANGLTVLHRYTRAIPGKFHFYLSAEGGLNLLNKAQTLQARSALEVISASGLRQMNGVALNQWLEKKNAKLTPNFNFFERGLYGHAASKDFEEMMQFLHVSLTEGAVNDQALERYLTDKKRYFHQRGSSKQYILRRYQDTAIYNNHEALKTLTRNDLKPLTKDAMDQIYRDYFYGAQNYRLVIVGDIPRSKAFPKIFKYLATLPPSGSESAYPLQTYPFPKKSMDIDIAGSPERVVRLFKRLVIRKESVQGNRFDQAYFLTYWLNQQLTEMLREKQGLTYTVGSNVEGLESVRPDLTLEIWLTCDPKRINEVQQALNTALEVMRQNPPGQQDIDRWQRNHQNSLTNVFSHPMYQSAALARAPALGFSSKDVVDAKARSLPPSSAQLVSMLQEFIGDNSIQINTIWRPKK